MRWEMERCAPSSKAHRKWSNLGGRARCRRPKCSADSALQFSWHDRCQARKRPIVPRAAAPGRSEMERRESIAIASARERESSMAMRLGMGWAGNGRRMKTTLQASKLATCRRTSTSTSSPTESVGGAASSFDHRAHGRRHTQKGTLTPVPALSTTSTAIFNPVQSGQNARGIHCE